MKGKLGILEMGLLVGIGFLFGNVPAYGAESEAPPSLKAKANFVNSKGEVVGKAALEELSPLSGGEGPSIPRVWIDLEVSKLPPGVHALHIHSQGKCEPPDFQSAGDHLNPSGAKHGKRNPEGPHLGDLSNIFVGEDEKFQGQIWVAGVSLSGSGVNSLLGKGGTSLVIHAAADDELTDPTGNAGARIICGVIEPEASQPQPEGPLSPEQPPAKEPPPAQPPA